MTSLTYGIRVSEDLYFGEGVVDRVVHQTRLWRIKFQGTYWNAKSKCLTTLIPGDLVRIVGMQNTNLLIEPL